MNQNIKLYSLPYFQVVFVQKKENILYNQDVFLHMYKL